MLTHSAPEPPDDLAVLRLMVEWGADEALADAPIDRFTAATAASHPMPGAPPVATRPAAIPSQAMSPGTSQAMSQALATPAPGRAGQLAEAATSLADLHAALDGFTACPLRATASTTVAPSGDPAAGLVIVYESPGPDDDRAGQAMSGTPGARFDRVLASAGLDRSRFLVAPLVPWRPPGGRPASDAELALCLPFLHRLLMLAEPRRIVMLGAAPYRALAGEEGGFRKARGKWTEVTLPGLGAPVPAFAMLAPELWLSSAANKKATWADLIQLSLALA